MGLVNDTDPDLILPLLPKDATYYFTKADIPRALDEKVLKDFAKKHDLKGNSYPKVSHAVLAAKQAADKDDLIFIGGSTFVVAEALP
jgi:dihydrofolate synthase/folylpolyglutamate synthase